jgi:hypothetical protein
LDSATPIAAGIVIGTSGASFKIGDPRMRLHTAIEHLKPACPSSRNTW